MIKSAHNNYIGDIIGNSLNEPQNQKTFWTYVKHCKTENSSIPILKTLNGMHITDTDKAEALNSQFSSVFTRTLILYIQIYRTHNTVKRNQYFSLFLVSQNYCKIWSLIKLVDLTIFHQEYWKKLQLKLSVFLLTPFSDHTTQVSYQLTGKKPE